MLRIFHFQTRGHDAFIDFLKAYCIICVILAHNMPIHNAVAFSVWGGMQVPLFLLIQSFHGLKNGRAKLNWGKITKRFIVPFIIVQCFLLCFKIFKTDWSYDEVLMVIKDFICSGGFGPGSYYFWIYLQFAVILAITAPIFEKWSKQNLLILFVAVCVIGEILCSIVHLPEFIYRLLALRYIFLIFLGYLWVKVGVVINTQTILLSLFSVGSILFFTYTDYNLEPLFFQTDWKVYHWICYFWASMLLTYILYQSYSIIKKHSHLNAWIGKIGKASWEIYLIQMCLFVVIPKECFSFISCKITYHLFWILFTTIVSVGLGVLLHYTKNVRVK